MSCYWTFVKTPKEGLIVYQTKFKISQDEIGNALYENESLGNKYKNCIFDDYKYDEEYVGQYEELLEEAIYNENDIKVYIFCLKHKIIKNISFFDVQNEGDDIDIYYETYEIKKLKEKFLNKKVTIEEIFDIWKNNYGECLSDYEGFLEGLLKL